MDIWPSQRPILKAGGGWGYRSFSCRGCTTRVMRRHNSLASHGFSASWCQHTCAETTNGSSLSPRVGGCLHRPESLDRRFKNRQPGGPRRRRINLSPPSPAHNQHQKESALAHGHLAIAKAYSESWGRLGLQIIFMQGMYNKSDAKTQLSRIAWILCIMVPTHLCRNY